MNIIDHLKQVFVSTATWHCRAGLVPMLAVVLLSPMAFALEPPPGGGYPGETTALGEDALLNFNTSITGLNTAIGYQALYNDTTGSSNTGVGSHALHDNTEGGGNTAVGYQALYGNTTGDFNVAIGNNAMVANTTALEGTAVGFTALEANTTGSQNTAIGFAAMAMSTGAYNTAVGTGAMASNFTGTRNVAVGVGAMNMSGGGSNNTALGYAAGNTLLGTNNIVIGINAAMNLTGNNRSNNIEIGNPGVASDSNVIRIGDPAIQTKTFIAGIRGATLANGSAVMVNNRGQLGVATSSARFKEAIKPMDKASEAILSLKPVTFRYKKELDPEGIPQFGLVAEEVAKVDPDLVARDEEGKPYTVRYEAVNAMLLNEFLKEHRKVEAQSAEIGSQRSKIAALESTVSQLQSALKAQGAQIQKVSAEVEAAQNQQRLVSAKE